MTNRRNTEDINLGFGTYTNDMDYNKSSVQIITSYPNKPIEYQVRLCTKCHNRVTWVEDIHRFICYKCNVSYAHNFDVLPTSNDNSISPLQSNSPYEQIQPAFISYKPNKLQTRQDENIQISGSYRKANIKTKGLPNITEQQLRDYFTGEGTIG